MNQEEEINTGKSLRLIQKEHTERGPLLNHFPLSSQSSLLVPPYFQLLLCALCSYFSHEFGYKMLRVLLQQKIQVHSSAYIYVFNKSSCCVALGRHYRELLKQHDIKQHSLARVLTRTGQRQPLSSLLPLFLPSENKCSSPCLLFLGHTNPAVMLYYFCICLCCWSLEVSFVTLQLLKPLVYFLSLAFLEYRWTAEQGECQKPKISLFSWIPDITQTLSFANVFALWDHFVALKGQNTVMAKSVRKKKAVN